MFGKKHLKNAFKALVKGQMETFKALLPKIKNINALYEEHDTLLLLAVGQNNLDAVALLIEQGADVNQPNSLGTAPLGLAGFRNHLAVFEYLLQHNATPVAEDVDHYLRLAICHDRLDLVKTFFEHPELEAKSLSQAYMLLSVTTKNIMDYFAQQGVGVHDTPDEYEHSAFVRAIKPDNQAQIDLFWQYKDDKKLQGVEGYLALTEACCYGMFDVAHKLLDLNVPVSPLAHEPITQCTYSPFMYSVEVGQLAFMQRLLDNGVDIHDRVVDEFPFPLEIAFRSHQSEAISWLLEKGATADNLAELRAEMAEEQQLAASLVPPQSKLDAIINQLQACFPEADTRVMHTNHADYFDNLSSEESLSYALFFWITDVLTEHKLIDYQEWKMYWGKLPELNALAGLHLDEVYDPSLIIEGIQNAKLKRLFNRHHEFDMYIQPLPYLEYMSYVLKPHGLVMLSLETENLYMLCVQDDDHLIGQIQALFAETNTGVVRHEPMTVKACIDYFYS